MKAEFTVITPHAVDYLPKEALAYLDKAQEGMTSDLTPKDVIAYAKAGMGDIILITITSKISGVVFFMYGDTSNGKVLNVASLGADRIMDWKDSLLEFTIKQAKLMNCNEIVLVSRKGWGRVFPVFKPVGVVYSLKV